MEIQRELNRIKKIAIDKYPERYIRSSKAITVYSMFAERYGWRKAYVYDADRTWTGTMTVGQFCKEHPKNIYVLQAQKHLERI